MRNFAESTFIDKFKFLFHNFNELIVFSYPIAVIMFKGQFPDVVSVYNYVIIALAAIYLILEPVNLIVHKDKGNGTGADLFFTIFNLLMAIGMGIGGYFYFRDQSLPLIEMISYTALPYLTATLVLEFIDNAVTQKFVSLSFLILDLTFLLLYIAGGFLIPVIVYLSCIVVFYVFYCGIMVAQHKEGAFLRTFISLFPLCILFFSYIYGNWFTYEITPFGFGLLCYYLFMGLVYILQGFSSFIKAKNEN